MNNKQIPIVILNRDRFHPVVEQVNALQSKVNTNIIIIDNQSTYQPLLDWYKTSNVDVFYNDITENYHIDDNINRIIYNNIDLVTENRMGYLNNI
jgi:hypothetical protein